MQSKNFSTTISRMCLPLPQLVVKMFSPSLSFWPTGSALAWKRRATCLLFRWTMALASRETLMKKKPSCASVIYKQWQFPWHKWDEEDCSRSAFKQAGEEPAQECCICHHWHWYPCSSFSLQVWSCICMGYCVSYYWALLWKYSISIPILIHPLHPPTIIFRVVLTCQIDNDCTFFRINAAQCLYPGVDEGCFSPLPTMVGKGKGQIFLKDLNSGDLVQATSGKFCPFLFDPHSNQTKFTPIFEN